MENQRYKVVSLFSGAMGLDVGLEQTGQFETLAAVEHEAVFCDTIRANRDAGNLFNPFCRIYNSDIRLLDPHALRRDLRLQIGELDVLVGGPPCQTFSTTGKRQTTQDPRGTLLWDYLRFIEAFQPKFFLLENVRGLVSAAIRHRPIKNRPEHGGPPLQDDEMPGSVLRLFSRDLAALKGAAYRLDGFEVNAVNYGAPQLRERLVCIGNRLGHTVEFPAPTHAQNPEPGSGQKPFRTLGDAIKGVREIEPEVLDFSPRKKSYLAKVPPGGNWRSLPVEMQIESMGKAHQAKGGRSGWWRRLSYDLPCPTIVTMPNHASTALCHPKFVRALSAFECALVQEFPRNWVFCGKVQEKYAQIGNAVPVRLGAVAGEVMAKYLRVRAGGARGDHSHGAARGGNFRIVYLASHVRTRKWYKKGETYVWKGDRANAALRYAAPVTKRKERAI